MLYPAPFSVAALLWQTPQPSWTWATLTLDALKLYFVCEANSRGEQRTRSRYI